LLDFIATSGTLPQLLLHTHHTYHSCCYCRCTVFATFQTSQFIILSPIAFEACLASHPSHSSGIGRKLHGFVERTARACAAAGEVESGGGSSSSSHTSILHPVEEFLRALVQPAGANFFHQRRADESMIFISQNQPKLAIGLQTPDHCAAAVDGRIIVRRQQSCSIGSIQYAISLFLHENCNIMKSGTCILTRASS
jgi:hypothetical protein